jgi:XTP/dITP diphosphohydrolase
MLDFERLVLASGNPGKLGEIQALLAPLGIEVVPQSALGIDEPEEPHATFLENALLKARHASRLAGLPALADDSGLCVAGLGGAPGVDSAYYAGREGTRAERDERNNRRLVAEVAALARRDAHYRCVMILVRRAADPEPLVSEGVWRGEIALSPRGANGFGYDPYFLVPTLGRTAAELSPDEKNRISHRGLAAKRLLASLAEEAA